MGFHGPGCGLRRNTRHPDLVICVQRYSKTCQKQRNEKENQQWTIEKPMLDNARRLRGIYFADPADATFKETIEMR